MKINKKLAFNPYLPGYEYIPDGEPYVFGDRVYIYGSYDESKGTTFCTGDYVCWSAPTDDLKWTEIEIPIQINKGIYGLFFNYYGKGYLELSEFTL